MMKFSAHTWSSTPLGTSATNSNRRCSNIRGPLVSTPLISRWVISDSGKLRGSSSFLLLLLCFLRVSVEEQINLQTTSSHKNAKGDKNLHTLHGQWHFKKHPKIAYHDFPLVPREDSAPHLQNHPCQEPEQASNAVPSLVVGWDADIDIPHGRVSITEGNGGDVPQSRLLDRLQTVTNNN